ncbi:hypothetical protein BZZ01_28320 [Nostocales cyanobacterium HT-58-2]|nr:hypothetical protein BZZ01_28320 [Nostocales cyanobacterium HT-58-2]
MEETTAGATTESSSGTHRLPKTVLPYQHSGLQTPKPVSSRGEIQNDEFKTQNNFLNFEL